MLGGDFDIIVAEDGAQGWEILQQDNGRPSGFHRPQHASHQRLRIAEAGSRTSQDEGLRNLPVIVVTGAEMMMRRRSWRCSRVPPTSLPSPSTVPITKARAMSHANYHRTTKPLQTGIDWMR